MSQLICKKAYNFTYNARCGSIIWVVMGSNLSYGFLTKYGSNQITKLQRLVARILRFCLELVEILYIPDNKGVDQTVDAQASLHLCCSKQQSQVYSHQGPYDEVLYVWKFS